MHVIRRHTRKSKDPPKKRTNKKAKPRSKKKPKNIKWRFNRINIMIIDEDLDWVKWVERYAIGTTHPLNIKTESQINKEIAKLNKALRYGKIIGTERNFILAECDNKEIITEYMVYHIGFKYRPKGK